MRLGLVVKLAQPPPAFSWVISVALGEVFRIDLPYGLIGIVNIHMDIESDFGFGRLTWIALGCIGPADVARVRLCRYTIAANDPVNTFDIIEQIWKHRQFKTLDSLKRKLEPLILRPAVINNGID